MNSSRTHTRTSGMLHTRTCVCVCVMCIANFDTITMDKRRVWLLRSGIVYGVAARARERGRAKERPRRRSAGVKKVWTNVGQNACPRGNHTRWCSAGVCALTPVFNSRKPCRSRFLFCGGRRVMCLSVVYRRHLFSARRVRPSSFVSRTTRARTRTPRSCPAGGYTMRAMRYGTAVRGGGKGYLPPLLLLMLLLLLRRTGCVRRKGGPKGR
jgi:hypothetical protein